MTACQSVSWGEIECMIQSLSDQISKIPRNFSSITTMSRGGLIPSRLLADRLNIQNIYVDQDDISSDSLIVDDIFDTGFTFETIISKTDSPSDLIFVTLFARCGKNYPAQLRYAKQTDSDAYVVFPWDRFEFIKNSK